MQFFKQVQFGDSIAVDDLFNRGQIEQFQSISSSQLPCVLCE